MVWAPASSAFSISSFTTQAGRPTPSPAALWEALVWGQTAGGAGLWPVVVDASRLRTEASAMRGRWQGRTQLLSLATFLWLRLCENCRIIPSGVQQDVEPYRSRVPDRRANQRSRRLC